MKESIEIAQEAKLRPIAEVAAAAGLEPEEIEPYGRFKAKVAARAWERLRGRPDGRLILVTAINPTPAGEGKTTTSIGLGQALHRLGKRAIVAIREPSLGPCFGLKGGATGGGYAQVVPMEEINLHFTGDFHAVTSANNLLCALADSHIQQGNALDLDPAQIAFHRVLDMNDRVLRQVVVGLGGPANGPVREERFKITVASEVMAILCLATDLADLRARLGRIVVGYSRSGNPVTAADLRAEGAMTALLRDALQPNLVQTLEGSPALIHGGPFANIAHGCNSLMATRTALKLADYVVTEAGFGADLGAEKFLDIKCRYGGLRPEAAVVVATVRALKYHGGLPRKELDREDLPALRRGMANLEGHIENLGKFGLPAVVAINRFPSDTPAELEAVREACTAWGVPCALSEVFARGGEGGEELARAVLDLLAEGRSDYRPLYPLDLPLEAKIERVATEIYGAARVEFSAKARKQLERFTELGWAGLPVCLAKTPFSFSDDPTLLGRPRGFTLHVRELSASVGAGFIVALTGDILTMPGLPKEPAACRIDVTPDGRITGLA